MVHLLVFPHFVWFYACSFWLCIWLLPNDGKLNEQSRFFWFSIRAFTVIIRCHYHHHHCRLQSLNLFDRSSNRLKPWSSLTRSTLMFLLGRLQLSLLPGEKARLPRFLGLFPISSTASRSSSEMLRMVAMERWWWRLLLPKERSKFPTHLEERVNIRRQSWSSKQLKTGQGLHSTALTTTQGVMTSVPFAALFWMMFVFPLLLRCLVFYLHYSILQRLYGFRFVPLTVGEAPFNVYFLCTSTAVLPVFRFQHTDYR